MKDAFPTLKDRVEETASREPSALFAAVNRYQEDSEREYHACGRSWSERHQAWLERNT